MIINHQENSPNVLLLTIDSLRADAVAAEQNGRLVMPNINRLAQTGIRFNQAISPGSWTQAAFPGILTSTYASMYGGCLGVLSRDRPSLVEKLANSGFDTVAFSTSPLLSRAYGYDRGFRNFVDLIPEVDGPRLRNVKGGQRLLRSAQFHRVAQVFGKNLKPSRMYVSAESANRAFYDWLPESTSPFFAWIHYMDPHWPYFIEEELEKPEDIALAWQALAQLYDVNEHSTPMSTQTRNYIIGTYHAALHYIDKQIGSLLAHLRELGRLEDTFIIVVSDHGEEFLERSHWGHFETNLHDEIIRVPMIFRIPGGPRGKTVFRLVRTLDLMPTVLDICGIAPPDSIVGQSLAGLWDRISKSYEIEYAISERWRPSSHIVSVREERFKHIWHRDDPQKAMLFDLKTDPRERNNTWDKNPRIAEQMERKISVHVQEVMKTWSSNRPTQEVAYDERVENRLRGLGYIE